MVIVPVTTAGVDVVRDIPTMDHPMSGLRLDGGHAEVVYRDVRVPKENLVGSPGDGFRLARQRLGPGRIHHAMRWLGQSGRAFDMLCERAVSRYTHGSVLADKQMIQDMVATSAAEMQAARRILRGYPPRQVPTEHVPTRTGAARRKFAALPGPRHGRSLIGASGTWRRPGPP
jgi:alkylation response protein AidB-like acyl-CoA dehydrogenase